MNPEPSGTATSQDVALPARARFGSSEVPAARATQDRIDIPEFAPNLQPEGDIRPDRFLDRELSWLAFNSRVLELAEDPTLHLLERVSFLSIFASNLDEFFMVRVAGLKRRIATGLAVPSPAGLSPVEVLERISEEAHRLQERHAQVFADQIRPALAYEHIHLMHWQELDDAAKQQLSVMFAEKVFPILTPLAVDPAHPFPYISGLSLNLAVVVRNPVSDKELFARLKVPDQLPRLISIDGPRAGAVPGRVARFIALEEVIAVHLDKLFPGMEVLEHHTFRVTRNEDLEVEEDDAENLLQALEKELLRRRFGPPVRLEVANDINPNIRALLIRELGVEESEVYSVPAPRWTCEACR
ncbi:polyphosphate kinase 1 [Arthrobacter sp. SLBN-112]|nr:polyphosphate kinase 1 [Arthrobacter sp. SLBN-112]